MSGFWIGVLVVVLCAAGLWAISDWNTNENKEETKCQ